MKYTVLATSPNNNLGPQGARTQGRQFAYRGGDHIFGIEVEV